MSQQNAHQTPETTLEGRVFVLTLALIVLGVLLLKFSLEVGWLDRRVTDLETAVRRLNLTHEVP